jgi:hypothetical protein
MTAVLHPIELFLPGVVKPTSHGEFRVQRAAVQVTDDVRRRMAAAVTCEQRLWSLAVISAGLLFGLLTAYSARQHGLDAETQREALRPVLIAGILLLTYLHLAFSRQRQFVLRAPVATAEVVEERMVRVREADALSFNPHLALCYTPMPADPTEECAMLDGPSAPPEWAELDGYTEGLDSGLHTGDLVSILYDPGHPTHVRVVEG